MCIEIDHRKDENRTMHMITTFIMMRRTAKSVYVGERLRIEETHERTTMDVIDVYTLVVRRRAA